MYQVRSTSAALSCHSARCLRHPRVILDLRCRRKRWLTHAHRVSCSRHLGFLSSCSSACPARAHLRAADTAACRSLSAVARRCNSAPRLRDVKADQPSHLALGGSSSSTDHESRFDTACRVATTARRLSASEHERRSKLRKLGFRKQAERWVSVESGCRLPASLERP